MSVLGNLFLIGILSIIILYGKRILINIITFIVTLNEYKIQDNAPKILWEFNDMKQLSKLKKDEEMNDSEFNIKYGAFRHEVFRVTSVNRDVYELFGKILHNIELYYLYSGINNLNKLCQINKPIFIIGDFRSGTSVLERIIEHHSNVGAFSMTHSACIWQSPKLFEDIVTWSDPIRVKCGCQGWNSPKNKGIIYPHSSNNILSRHRPAECEIIFNNCKSCPWKNRHNNWDTLDDIKNPDNNTNMDLLDETFTDPEFEQLLKRSIQMLLLHRGVNRFIWKNPMNGFRIAWLLKLFPDCKFIHISRNPLKVTQSQYIMEDTFCKVSYINKMKFRMNNMDFKANIPDYNTKFSWYHMYTKQLPNNALGQLWFPHMWPRTKPYHHNIMKYIKSNKQKCAFAMGVAQHEYTVLSTFERLRNNGKIIDNKNLLTIWHENILKNAKGELKKIHEYLELKSNEKERISHLESEDFPNGLANIKRVNVSKDRGKIDKLKAFYGNESDQVNQILKDAMKRYNQQVKQS